MMQNGLNLRLSGAVLATLLVSTACLNILSEEAAAQQALNTQQRKDIYSRNKQRIKVQRLQSGDLDSLGYKIMDGILVVPELRVEGGYDSNHDKLFTEDDSSFGLVDGSLLFGYVKDDRAVTLTFKGSYDRFSDLDPDDRWDAGVSLDSYYRLNQNWEYSGGLFYLRDEVSLSENETFSSYSQLDYTTSHLEAYLRSESYDLKYTGETSGIDVIAPLDQPFFRDKAFDHRRHQIAGGAIFRPNQLVGYYANGGFGIINYTNQPDESVINKDADEFWISGGFRFNLSPHLRAELGWRYNDRDIDDATFGNYDSNGFDAKVIWVPNSLLAVTYEADTFLGESAAAFSVVADVERHSITVALRPTSRSNIDLYAARELRKEVGSGLKYDEEKFAATYSYDLTNTSQFYVSALYEHIEENATVSDYERFRIGVGYRMKFVRNPGEIGENVDLRQNILPGIQIIDTRVGYSRLHLPNMDMVAVTDAGHDFTVGHRQNHDGDVDGARIDFRVPGFAGIVTSPELERFGLGSRVLTFNFAGYYGHYESTQRSECYSEVGVNNCAFFNIIDSDPDFEDNTAPNGDFDIRTKKEVDVWGVSLEAQFNGWMDNRGSMKDTEPQHRPHRPFRLGMALKAIQQDTNLFAIDEAVEDDPIDYNEDLDTFYYGLYVGLDHQVDLGRGFSLGLNAEAGLYYADTQYKGSYLAFVDDGTGTGNYVLNQGATAFSENDISFIGSVRLELNKKLGRGVLGLFAEGEYYSYAPYVRYNDNDVSTGGVFSAFDIEGPNVGTSIDDGEAFSYTFGGRYILPLHADK